MKTKIANFLIPMLGGSATSAFASDAALQDGGGPLIWFFIGFGAFVLIMQAVPAAILLYSMVKAVFSQAERPTTAQATGHK